MDISVDFDVFSYINILKKKKKPLPKKAKVLAPATGIEPITTP